MQVDLATQLPCPLAKVIAQVRKPRLLRHQRADAQHE